MLKLGRITTTRPLDFETVRLHQLSVVVSDGALTATGTLTVDVEDVNEPHNITNLPNVTSISARIGKPGDVVRYFTVLDDNAHTRSTLTSSRCNCRLDL